MRALVVLACVVACGAPSTPPEPPRPPTALSMLEASPALDGKLVGPSDAHATVVVLVASWCGHCRHQLAQLDALRASHPRMRVLGVSYQGHEEYDNRGNPEQLRAYVAEHVPWLRVVLLGERLFDAFGRPPFVPAVWVYDARGELVEFYDRRVRTPPTAAELEALLLRLGA